MSVLSNAVNDRSAELIAESGEVLTDGLLARLLNKYPVGNGPTRFLVSRRSLSQLQQSRMSASPPTEAFGVPIIVTDDISDTEGSLCQ